MNSTKPGEKNSSVIGSPCKASVLGTSLYSSERCGKTQGHCSVYKEEDKPSLAHFQRRQI
jgi:hypothetical protein